MIGYETDDDGVIIGLTPKQLLALDAALHFANVRVDKSGFPYTDEVLESVVNVVCSALDCWYGKGENCD